MVQEDVVLANPLHVFNLIRRLAVDIPSIEQDWREDDWKGEQSHLIR